MIGTLEIILIITTILEFNPLMQSIKILRLKKVKDVSIWTYVMIFFIGVLWLYYGIVLNSLPLIIGNSIKLLASFSVIIVYAVYKR